MNRKTTKSRAQESKCRRCGTALPTAKGPLLFGARSENSLDPSDA